MITKAWKLFEVTENFEPRSLVHGHHNGTEITRNYAIDTWIHKSFDTPGFNVFSSYADMMCYLPRFRKRKTKLVSCQIHVSQLQSKIGSKYYLCENMFIPKVNWGSRIAGLTMLISVDRLPYESMRMNIQNQREKMMYETLIS